MVTSKNNLHFSAIISGLLFAAIHQQPLQILPIAFMGAGFAYLYHYTQNLKYTILLHFFVNAVQISSVFFLGGYQLF
ncbi:CPBP family intramembrane metalloprotease, partial [Crocinitomix catalasitica]|nr:CPBP family intramembrane metalloprotease [Crocinitomix catalasitica]